MKDSLSSRVLLGTIAKWVLIMLITENDGDNEYDDNGVDNYAHNVMEVCHISQDKVSTLPTYIFELMMTMRFVMVLVISVVMV